MVALVLQQKTAPQGLQVPQAPGHGWHHANGDGGVVAGAAAGHQHLQVLRPQVALQAFHQLLHNLLAVGNSHHAVAAAQGLAG